MGVTHEGIAAEGVGFDRTAVEAADPESAPAPEHNGANAHERFLQEHARTWMPQFAVAVGAQSREPFYRTAAELLKAVVTSER